jgi:hypothetical protein
MENIRLLMQDRRPPAFVATNDTLDGVMDVRQNIGK